MQIRSFCEKNGINQEKLCTFIVFTEKKEVHDMLQT